MIRRMLLVGCCVPLLASLAGCVMPDQLSQIQKDLADVRQQMNQLRSEQAEALRKLAEVEAQPEPDEDAVSRTEMADVGVRIDRVARDAAIADEQVNDLTRRFDGELGIQILRFAGPFYCESCDGIATERSCPHISSDPKATRQISGTEVRSILLQENSCPPELMRPEVVESLHGVGLFVTEDAE